MNKHLGLKIKFIFGIAILVFCISLTSIFIGAKCYKNSIMKRYNAMAYQIASTAEGYFTQEELAEYSELTTNFNLGKTDDKKIKEIAGSKHYKDIKSQLEKLRKSMGANDIFICFIDTDVLKEYTEEKANNKEWNPLYYIMDSYPDPQLEYSFGDKGPFNPDFNTDIANVVKSGKTVNNLFISKSKFGYNTSAAYPVVCNGKTVAIIGVEIPMLTLEKDISRFVWLTIAVISLTAVIVSAIGIYVLVRTMIKPIVIVAAEAENFLENGNVVSRKLDKIKTNDEIEMLSRNLLQMEIGINEYIENITKITAEKERIGAELNVATQIQADMLPRIFPAFPDRDEFDIYASMNPAKEVGGDFYDFFLIDNDHLAMVMADVSGKGVPAALFMVIAKTLIKNRALMGGSPSEILAYVNNQLCEGNEAELFVTVWFAIMEISTGKGFSANAGHEYPAIRRANGKYELVKTRHSPALATMEGIRFREHEFELHSGDSLFVYTDGVPEATNSHDELFGAERMLDALNKVPDAMPEKLLQTVSDEVNSFVGNAPQFDDLTMLGLHYFGKRGDDHE